MNSKPIFIMSSERSGSNLLRTLLSNHSNLSGPIAPHLLNNFSKLIGFYNNLNDGDNLQKLLKDMVDIANHKQYNWNVNIEKLVLQKQPSTFLDCFDILYRLKMEAEGKKRFVCKENNIFDYAFALQKYYDDIFFIYLYRDPRDYCASWMKVPFIFNTPYQAAKNWYIEQAKCISLIKAFDLPCCLLKYEDLILNPSDAMSRILTYVEEPIENSCFGVDMKKNETLKSNAYLKNLSNAIIADNHSKYRTFFSYKEINMIESITQPYMKMLGYKIITEANWKKTHIFRFINMIQNRINDYRLKKNNPETVKILSDRSAFVSNLINKRIKYFIDD